jgi:hypothetical protein
MEYSITFPRVGVAEPPSPWTYFTHFARAAAQMGYTYGVVGDRGVVQPGGRPLQDAHAHDIVGTPAACIDKVRRWKAARAQALFLVPRGADPLGQMRRFMTEVASQA